MRELRVTAQFRRDDRRIHRRGKDTNRMDRIVEKLVAGERWEPQLRAHRLSGDLSPYWECHIESDWLLIWDDDGSTITLIRTGTHSDLFRR
jgi:mRNA interferase YafQ